MQRASLVEKSRQKPQERIRTVVRNYRYDEDPVLDFCGVGIDKQLVQVEGRVLEAPKLKVGHNEDCIPCNGRDGTLITRGSQEQQAQPYLEEISPSSWYPLSVVSSPIAFRPSTPSSSTSSSFNLQRPSERAQSPSHVSPVEAASI